MNISEYLALYRGTFVSMGYIPKTRIRWVETYACVEIRGDGVVNSARGRTRQDSWWRRHLGQFLKDKEGGWAGEGSP